MQLRASNTKYSGATDRFNLNKRLVTLLIIVGLSMSALLVASLAAAARINNDTGTRTSLSTEQEAAGQEDTSKPTDITPPASDTSSSSMSTSSVTANGETRTSVQVNGRDISVPKNGSRRQTITTPEGTTSLNISNTQNSNGNSTTFSSTHSNVMVNSLSQSTDVEVHN